jgi:hypothetical protein
MTALIVAALHGNLPAGTTAQDLRNGKKFNGKSPLELLAKDQVMTVLNNLGAADGDEFAGSLEC